MSYPFFSLSHCHIVTDGGLEALLLSEAFEGMKEIVDEFEDIGFLYKDGTHVETLEVETGLTVLADGHGEVLAVVETAVAMFGVTLLYKVDHVVFHPNGNGIYVALSSKSFFRFRWGCLWSFFVAKTKQATNCLRRNTNDHELSMNFFINYLSVESVEKNYF